MAGAGLMMNRGKTFHSHMELSGCAYVMNSIIIVDHNAFF